METVEILIRLSKDEYEEIKETNTIKEHLNKIDWAVRNGTVLPEGHGRLIDADELKKHKYHDNNRFENAVAVAQIDWADTIIEADKEE